MRKIFTVILLALFYICGYAQVIDPVLLQEMAQRTEDEKINVVVVMKSQYDRQQLGRQAMYYTSRAERRAFMVTELKRYSEASQYDIRESLARMEVVGLTTEPKVLWVANALCFSATKSAIEDLAARNDVEIIGFDREEYMLFDDNTKAANNTREITQNVLQVRANEVWALGYTGAGIVVAVIDSGVNYNHLDLADHLWDGGVEFPHHGWDFVNNDNDPMDDNGHGTHCAGTVCGDGSAGSQTGMAPDASLMILKCMNSAGRGTTSNCVNSMQWAVEHGCDVISMSLGAATSDVTTRTLYRNACVSVLDAGVVAAIAAGNEGYDLVSNPIPYNVGVPGACPPPYLDPRQALNPGGLSCTVCVGAVDYNDAPAYFTSQGPVTWSNTSYADYPYSSGSAVEFGLIRPDVCAPGVSVKSANYLDITGYTSKDGTSMATPCVAGCMALVLSKDPNLTPAEMCKLLEETSVPLSNSKSNLTGAGRVDVMAAISNMPSGSLKLNSFTINDSQGNNDNMLNPGESVAISLTLLNDSDLSVDNASIELSSESEYVNIINGVTQLPHFNGHQTRVISNAFSFSLDDDVLPGNVIAFSVDVIVNGEHVGVIPFSITVYDYLLHYKELVFLNDDNGNGSLEPGETADMRIYVENGGNVQANSLVGTLGTSYGYLSLIETVKPFGNIAPSSQAYADYHVALSSNAPQNYNIDMSLTLVDANNRQSLLEFDHERYAVTASLNIEGSGSITGTGFYDRGATCVLTVTPNEGYLFENWSKNDEMKHTKMSYSFVVSEESDYMANLVAIEGIHVGSGEAYDTGLPGATSAVNKYSLSQQIYMADEIGQAGYIRSIAFYNDGHYQLSNYSIYLKHTTKSDFQSGTDWETVSTSDLVFSGQFDFPVGVWTVLDLNVAFEYNGTSNLLLVVDDNSGPRNPVFGRAYYGNGYQALYISSMSNDIDPLNMSGVSGYRKDMKNQIILDIVNQNTTYTVSVGPNTVNGGTVSGGNTYYVNTLCTVTASPNAGYEFKNWTENGNVVSTESSYTFAVLNNRNLIANFYSTAPISFADANVKALCVANWDTNSDGELSYAEAASVTDLGNVFRWSSNITSFDELQFFVGLKTIGDYAFGSCSNLTSILIPNSVTSIESGAFSSCYKLTSLMIPEFVSSIGNSAFSNCYGLEQITVAGGNVVFDSRNNCNAIIKTNTNSLIFGCKNTIVPVSTRSIGSNAFKGIRGLESLNIPASVTTIADNAFTFGKNDLVEITVHPDNPVYDSRDNSNMVVKTSDDKIVVGCKNTIIPNTIRAIGDYAFYNCDSLASIVIPSLVNTIGNYAFYACSSLSSISIHAINPPALNGDYVFDYVDKSIPITVYCEGIESYNSTPGWRDFTFYQTFDPCSQVITASANPIGGGTVAGGGTYYVGDICTLTAIPNDGFLFTHWTRNGEIVSMNSSYSFHVGIGGEYVASFIAVDGLYIGEGEEVSSYLPSYYCYSMSQQIYMAEEIGSGVIQSIAFYNAGAEDARNFSIYMKTTDKSSFNTTYSWSSSSSDWIPVTESDLVFSGVIVMARGDWTVISLDTPFPCDGLSNIVVAIDDNTGAFSYSNNMNCRVFNTSNKQSIYVYSYGTNYNPYNPSAYSGTVLSMKNQVILGMEHDDSFAVNVTKDINGAGVVTGAGIYNYGTTCTLRATANAGYTFRYWMEEGVAISFDSEFSFVVRRAYNLTAVFSADASIPFVDANVKALCVTNWDTNGDGELSFNEAEAVTDLGQVFRNNSTITTFDELRFFTGLTTIGDRAFYSCSSLTSAAVPNSVTTIGQYAFANCYYLTSIELSNALTEIQSSAFTNCSRLTSINIPNAVTAIGYSAFYSCSGLVSLEIPASVASIGNYAFSYCTGLEQITVAENNGYFDSREGCNAIIETTTNTLRFGCKNSFIPNTVTALGDNAFRSVDIQSVHIPESVLTIGTTVFVGCTLLEQITVSENNSVFDSRNNCNAIVETSTNELLVGCKNTIIPNTVTKIGTYAFYNCNGLTSIVVPNSVTTISQYAFEYCYYLTSIELSNSLITIQNYAFYNCYRLNSINIPASVTSIGNYAFAYCTGLTSMTIQTETPPTVYSSTFYSCPKSIPVYVPCGRATAYQSAQYWSEFTDIQEVCSQQTIELSEGWNWVSFYVEGDAVELLEMLEDGLGDSGIQIESVVDGVDMNVGEGVWVGDLMSIGLMNEHTYMIEVTGDVTFELQGPAADPADHPITIYPEDWSWIGYPCAEEVDINVALAGLEAEEGDMIETLFGEEGGMVFYYGGVWVGDFDTMIPGRGYMYFSNSTEEKTFVFQTEAKAKADSSSGKRKE